jgi:hypothetical protein
MALIAACLISCGSETSRQESGPTVEAVASDSIKSTDSAGSTATILPPFNLETAETLVAIHYSALNREAKYPLYKGLLIKIDTILPARGDSLDFTATIYGRKWLTPNGDTATKAFRTRESFTAYPQGRQWTANPALSRPK